MLSSRARYATRAVLDLSQQFDKGPTHIKEIAERQNIPVGFLQQILGALKMTGFVVSQKGPGGGFTLSRKPADISLGAVLRAMDGPLAPTSCVSQTRRGECGCPDAKTCPTRDYFQQARDTAAEILDSTSFADLIAPGKEIL